MKKLPFIHENLPFSLFVYTNATKTHNENRNFESCYKSLYFENGTTSHLSFSSCKRQKRFETDTICIRLARDFYFVLQKAHALRSRYYQCCDIHLICF